MNFYTRHISLPCICSSMSKASSSARFRIPVIPVSHTPAKTRVSNRITYTVSPTSSIFQLLSRYTSHLSARVLAGRPACTVPPMPPSMARKHSMRNCLYDSDINTVQGATASQKSWFLMNASTSLSVCTLCILNSRLQDNSCVSLLVDDSTVHASSPSTVSTTFHKHGIISK